jgi:hypothetical protein
MKPSIFADTGALVSVLEDDPSIEGGIRVVREAEIDLADVQVNAPAPGDDVPASVTLGLRAGDPPFTVAATMPLDVARDLARRLMKAATTA